MTDTIVSNLVINKLTRAQYDQIENPSDTELYLIPDEIDDTPTSGSDNPVTSDGVYNAISGKQDTISDLTTIRSGASAGATAYQKPSGGIPKTDLASAVQTSLGKADSALQSHQDISGKENTSNKVISLSSSSTDTQYPSAKCVYDLIKDNCVFIEGQDIYEDISIVNNNYYFVENNQEFNDF